MVRVLAAIILALVGLQAGAAEMGVHRDLVYAGAGEDRRALDLYAPGEGKDHPVLVWIHGGGWRRGDKSAVQHKPEAFTARGYVFVSVNYRFVPAVGVKDQAADIAKAIAWVHRNVEKHGGAPETIFLAGHSAGAHLAALVATDGRYLAGEGLSLELLKGCIPVDTATYDIPAQVKSVSPLRSGMYTGAFGPEEAGQKELSPIAHVAEKKHIPPFLLLHVADRADSRAQSEAFAKALTGAGVEARVVAAKGKNHGTINRDLGSPDDEPSKAVFDFLERILRQSTRPAD